MGHDTRSKGKGLMALAAALGIAYHLAVALLVRPWSVTMVLFVLGLGGAYWAWQRAGRPEVPPEG